MRNVPPLRKEKLVFFFFFSEKNKKKATNKWKHKLSQNSVVRKYYHNF